VLGQPAAAALARVDKQLVSRRVAGRTHICRLEPRALGTAEEWLSFYQRFWTERFDALESALKAQDVAAAAKTAAR
jgi:hypothetical protein